jgi:hypothetical protein
MCIKKVNKNQLRSLLGISPTTWRRWWREQKLHIQLGLTESEFNQRHHFYLKEYDTLKSIIGFEDADLKDI